MGFKTSSGKIKIKGQQFLELKMGNMILLQMLLEDMHGEVQDHQAEKVQKKNEEKNEEAACC